jgi:tetratricopeptide (TPR) repeat protein
MKKAVCIVILAAAVLLASCATTGGGSAGISLDEAIQQSAEEISAKLPAKSRVLIAAFDSPNTGLSNYIMEELTGSLIGKNIEVADRRSLEYLLNFQMSAELSDESAQSTGKFLGAQLVISGALTDIGEAYRFRISAIQVETATFLSVPRFDVRNDRAMRDMVTALARQKTPAEAAKYGVSEQTVPQTTGTFLDRGIMFAMRKNYEAAIADFTQAIRSNPKLAGAFILRGRALLAGAGLLEGVDEDFKGIRTADFTLSKDAEALQKKNRTNSQAMADFTEAIRLDPNNAAAYNERGAALHQSAEYNRALEDFNQAIRLNPNSAETYIKRGDTYYFLRDFIHAVEDYTRAIQLDPQNKYAYMERAWAYQFQAEYDPAIEDYTGALQLDPRYKKAYMERGRTYREREEDLILTSVSYKPNYAGAIADFTRVIQLDSNYAEAYSERALTYQSRKDYDRAIADLTRAMQIDPDNKYFYIYRGDAYMGKKDYNRAIADYEDALRKDPGDISIQRAIQRATQERGD